MNLQARGVRRRGVAGRLGRLSRAAGIVCLAVWLLADPAAAQGPDAALCEQLRNRIEAAGMPARLEVGGHRIHAVSALPQFYQRRAFEPAWTAQGAPAPRAFELLAAVRRADQEGLTPSNYHLQAGPAID